MKNTKKVQKVDTLFEALRIVLGIIIAFIICLAIIALIAGPSGAKDAIYNFVVGPFTTKRRIGMTLHRMACYMLVGSGMCFVYSSGRFSLIGEGIIILAPTIVCLLMFCTNLLTNNLTLINLIIMVVSCVLIGGLISLLPAFGKEELNANETVTSSIFNSFCLYVSIFLVHVFAQERGLLITQTPTYPDNMRFARYWGNTNFTTGFWVACIGMIIAIILFYRTRLGVEIRICGSNINFAKASGINIKKARYAGQILGGLFAGAAGCLDCFGVYAFWQYSALTSIGTDGLIVSVMANNQPLLIPFSAFIMAYIRTAADCLNAGAQIPIEIVTMLQAVIILFVAAKNFLKNPREKAIQKIAREEANLEVIKEA